MTHQPAADQFPPPSSGPPAPPYPGQSQAYGGQPPPYPGQSQAYGGQSPPYPGQTPPYPGQSQAYPGQPPPYPGESQAYPGQIPPYPGYPTPPPPPSGRWQPERIDQMPGTPFGLVQLRVMPITSGLAVGSMIAGIASILVSFLVFCFGVQGAKGGWGGWVSGAFTVLSVVVGAGAITLGAVSRRQIRGSGRTGQVRFTGKGLAIAGLVCGSVGAGIALLSLALALMLLAAAK